MCFFPVSLVAVLRYEGADPRTGRFCQVPLRSQYSVLGPLHVSAVRMILAVLSPESTMLASTEGIQVLLFENVVLEFGILVSSRCTTSLDSCATKFFITSRCTDAILHERGIADFLRKSILASSVGLDVVVAASSMTFWQQVRLRRF